MPNQQTVPSGLVLKPSFTMPVGFVGTWIPGPIGGGNSVFGEPVIAIAAYWKNPPPGAGPTVIPTCSIQTPEGLVWNGPSGQIPFGTPVMSPSGVYLGILGTEPGQVAPPVGSAVAPTWEPLNTSPIIPCEIPVAPTGTALELAQQMQVIAAQLITKLTAQS
jgi:hypothetical protein